MFLSGFGGMCVVPGFSARCYSLNIYSFPLEALSISESVAKVTITVLCSHHQQNLWRDRCSMWIPHHHHDGEGINVGRDISNWRPGLWACLENGCCPKHSFTAFNCQVLIPALTRGSSLPLSQACITFQRSLRTVLVCRGSICCLAWAFRRCQWQGSELP